MSDTNVVVHYQTGTLEMPLEMLLRDWTGAEPDWSWYEPRPGSLLGSTYRAADLHPTLRPGTPDIPAPVRADEARLFWADGGVHLLADGTRSRWFQWREGSEPRWIDAPARAPQQTKVQRSPAYGIRLRDRYDAFGLGGNRPPQHRDIELHVAEYWQNGELLTWTLIAKSKGGQS